MDQILKLGDFSSYTDLGPTSNGTSSTNGTISSNGTSKRRKMDKRRDDAFKPGNITQVTLKNFTTYSYATFNLSPTLNMIIGPNGTGKSTLVAAICLGLGGKLDLIKRKLLKSMIKSGQDTAEITIILVDESYELLTIHREFTEKTTIWHLNNSKVLERQVVNRIKNLNIQLDNLCHFLPQERVAEFAGLSPERLLLETQRTLKSGNLYIMHEDLMKLDDERDSAMQRLSNLSDDLNFLESEQEKLTEEVKKLQQYNDKVQEFENHKLLLPYAIREEEKRLKADLKQKFQDAKAKLDDFDNHHKPLSDGKELTIKNLRENEKSIASQLKVILKCKAEYEKSKDSAATIKKEIDVFLGQLKSRKSSKESTMSNIEKLKEEVTELSNKLADFEDSNRVGDTELKDIRSERSRKAEELGKLKYALGNTEDDLSTRTRRLERLRIFSKQEESKLNSKDKLNMLAPSNFSQVNSSSQRLITSAFQLHRKLRQRPDLKPHYLEAPFVTCEVMEKSIAGLIERIVTINTLLALTFTSQGNFDKVSSSTTLLRQLNAPTRIAKQNAGTSPVPRTDLKQYGFDGFLSDYIKGPPAVINMINLNSKLNLIPVSFKPLTDEQISKLVTPDSNKRVPFMRFVAGQQLFTLNRSKYGSKQVVYTTETVTESRFFGVQGGLSALARGEIESKIQELKGDIETISGEIQDLEGSKLSSRETMDALRSEIKELDIEVKKLTHVEQTKTKLKAAIKSRNDKIEKLKREYHEDRSEEIRAIRAKIIERNKTLSDTYSEVGEINGKLAQETFTLNKLKYANIDLLNKSESIEMLLNELTQYKQSLVQLYETAKSDFENMKQSDASKQIREQRKHYTEDQESQIADLAKRYIDDDVLNEKYIREKLNLLQDEMTIMSTADNNSINRLRDVETKLEELRLDLPKAEQIRTDLDERIMAIEQQWEPELQRLVNKISQSFQRKFVSVASDGQVQLTKGVKYKDWRLEVLVKFRNESDLKVLDRQSQSGGERAVSTIFFIMALQGLTQAPLRIVDEINQGMDPKNEKMAHKYLVSTACQSSNSQYFLVTPKLLTGLYYHPKMKIHCIYTGPLIELNKGTSRDFMDFTNHYDSGLSYV